MNILITGAKGFIGSSLVKKLYKSHKIIKLINGTSYSFSNEQAVCALTCTSHIDKLLAENFKIDMIIHTASVLTSIENSEQLFLFHDNIKMYENLLLIIKKFKPIKVINLSSVAVYPNQDGIFSETSEIRPSINNDGLYGLAKFFGENILDFFNKNTDTKVVHLRISQVYGKGVREDRIMKIMQNELEETNMVTVFGNGRRVSNFIDINTLLERIIFFIKHNQSGIFNIGDKHFSYKDIALDVIKKYGDNSSKINIIDTGISSQCLINSDKFKKIKDSYEL